MLLAPRATSLRPPFFDFKFLFCAPRQQEGRGGAARGLTTGTAGANGKVYIQKTISKVNCWKATLAFENFKLDSGEYNSGCSCSGHMSNTAVSHTPTPNDPGIAALVAEDGLRRNLKRLICFKIRLAYQS
jgi:hypothetical protein